ncbi:3-keto-disaccharide hydrolase [Nitrospira lenta]|uniref:3-keto-alpha-glucoside-1,2-lyase/3-keto-2-hydroxy-glucal hydratase domain-containing protein n=1 Tax=Nitrospira lenta TaxID=1436998 RepID=A0A330L7F9_9BACT|nr:DUF1080 domain-containing protein [Nitrospira lenta]SPP65880.1 conserved exported hypothetical protein [Nitrospira lenta]
MLGNLIQRKSPTLLVFVVFPLSLLVAIALFTQSVLATESDFIGRWNLTLFEVDGYASAWLEIKPTASKNKSGQLVWIFGGAEPLEDVSITEGILSFSHQFMGKRLHFTARYAGNTLTGTATDHRSTIRWIGVRAPELRTPTALRQGAPLALFTGHTLSGWTLRNGSSPYCWHIEESVLFNDHSCADLRSNVNFMNFHLHLEFRLDDEGGSGVYLRGRYEVQITTDGNGQPGTRSTGAIFGHIAPTLSVGKQPGEWQTLEVTLIGREVAVRLNHHTVIANERIPGPTGAALDSNEDRPGPIMLQGDHGRVSFRNIVITPFLNEIP